MTRFLPWKDTPQELSNGIQKANEQAPSVSHIGNWATHNNKYLPGPARPWGHVLAYRTPVSTHSAVASTRGSADSAVKPDRSTPTQVQPVTWGVFQCPRITTEPVGHHIFQNLFLHSLHSSMLLSPTSVPSNLPPELCSHLPANHLTSDTLCTAPHHQEVRIPPKPASGG